MKKRSAASFIVQSGMASWYGTHGPGCLQPTHSNFANAALGSLFVHQSSHLFRPRKLFLLLCSLENVSQTEEKKEEKNWKKQRNQKSSAL
jgi:hypothetical protein